MAITRHTTLQNYAWRARLAIALDLCVGLAMIPAIFFVDYVTTNLVEVLLRPPLPWYWFELLPPGMALAPAGAALMLLVWLARRGQTPGLAVVRMKWANLNGKTSERLLRNDLQFWCLAVPALWVLCDLPLGAAINSIESAMAYSGPLAPILDNLQPGSALALVFSGSALMLFSRRRQGQPVPRRRAI